MDPVLAFGAAFLGFTLTFFVWNRLVLWGYSLWTMRGGKDDQSKSAVAIPVLLFANSAPWLLVAYVAFLYFIFGNPHRDEWSWFWAGALAVAPVILLLVASVLRRRKKMKQSASGPAAGGSA
jgi:hypothetical protein